MGIGQKDDSPPWPQLANPLAKRLVHDVAELLAPLGTAKDWVCRALDEIDEARHTGDWEVVADRTYVLGRIIMSGEVTVP